MEPTPLWVNFITPVLTIVIVIAGFFASKIKLESKILATNENQDKQLENLSEKYKIIDEGMRTHSFCETCPQIIKMRGDQNQTRSQLEMLNTNMVETQKDVRALIRETAEVNARAQTAIQTMSESLAFLRSKKFVTAIEKLNGSDKEH